jgi:energy-coupling factor transporter ATP-binding protein EcfA2
VFKDIWLVSVWREIVIGSNGAGKSTLLKIMAGLDTEQRRRRCPSGHRSAFSAGADARCLEDRPGECREGVALARCSTG